MDHKERRNLYRILHVQPEAPAEVLKASYRALMSTARGHPDLGGDTERAALINHAYAVLADPERRSAYDRTLVRPLGPAAGGGQADPMRWAADSQRLFCPFCRTPMATLPSTDDGCAHCGAPLRPPPQARELHPELIGRRREARIERSDRAYLRLPGSAGDVVVRILDLSFGGIGLETGLAVREGSAIRVLTSGFDTVAAVLRCRRARSGFTVHGRLLTMRLLRRAGAFVSTKV